MIIGRPPNERPDDGQSVLLRYKEHPHTLRGTYRADSDKIIDWDGPDVLWADVKMWSTSDDWVTPDEVLVRKEPSERPQNAEHVLACVHETAKSVMLYSAVHDTVSDRYGSVPWSHVKFWFRLPE